MVTYKGLPAPLIFDFLSRKDSRSQYAPGTEFQIGRIEMVANTGTYLDSPFHRFDDGADLAELPLELLADLPGIVIRAAWEDGRRIDRTRLAAHIPQQAIAGHAVLIRTGWDRHWRTEQYFEGHPYLTEDAAEFLVRQGTLLVGIDSLNIDDTEDARRPVHTKLLSAGIPIVEHLCQLGELPPVGFRFSAVPVKVRGMGSFPVRAYALL